MTISRTFWLHVLSAGGQTGPVTQCAFNTAPVGAGMSTADMMDVLLNAPLTRCDEIPWSLLGVSMAGWNALISAGAALCAAAVLLFTAPRKA